jgi:NACalpha-BTF3-like transcription factor
MKLTVKQSIDLYNAITNMKSGGIYVKGLKNIDLAMNKKSVEPIFDGYKLASEPPEKYKKYVEEVEDLKLKVSEKDGTINNPEIAYTTMKDLKEKYKDAIKEYDDWKIVMKELINEERDVKIIKIKKTDVHFSDDNNSSSPEIIFGLLPCIEDEDSNEE